ncbi:MAG TPA: TetR/AcrR family transcriptional regulator [Acidimicrobiia bacterium]
MGPSSDTKRPGRPRDETIDEEIVSSLFELIEEVGLGAVTIDAIADRAGVSKATIYRRWQSKEDLIVDAVAGLVNAPELDQPGDIRQLMLSGLNRIQSFMSETTAGLVFPWLVAEVTRGSEIGKRYSEAVIAPRRQAIAAQIEGAVKRGELRADLDVELAVDMFTGPVIIRKMMGRKAASADRWAESLMDYLLNGWAPAATE